MRRGREWQSWRFRGLKGWDARRGLPPVTLALAAAIALLGFILLRSLWVVFQHAYLNSYLYVPGTHITSAYWGAIGFALRATVLVVALVAAVLALVAALFARGRRH
ncbi:MAG TPA: hypothetical protein VNM16_02615 [Bacillota bacterium]|nr:hypothetical protein [Bacillota bacterium]